MNKRKYYIKITRASRFYRCFTILRLRQCGILRSHKSGIIFTCFLTFIWWRKTGMLNVFCGCCGTDIGANNSSQSRSSE